MSALDPRPVGVGPPWWSRIVHDPIVRATTSALLVLGALVVGLLVGVDPSDGYASDWGNVERGLTIALGVATALWLVIVLWVVTRDDSSRRTSYLDVPIPGWEQMAIEATAMAQYASKRGIAPRPEDSATLYRLETLSGPDWERVAEGRDAGLVASIAAAHADLAAKVRPATPHTIALLANKTRGQRPLAWLGNVRLVRMLVGLSIVLLLAFVGLAISSASQINGLQQLIDEGPFLDRVLGAAYLLVAAALGASFAALRKMYHFIDDLSYDEKYESSYWIRFVQGMMAGLILSILLAGLIFGSDDATRSSEITGFRVTLPLLAFVGGFSEDLVFQLLRRIVEAFRTLARGSVQDELKSEAARLETEASQRNVEDRRKVAVSLMELKEDLPREATEVRAKIDEEIHWVLGSAPPPAKPADTGADVQAESAAAEDERIPDDPLGDL